MKTAYIKEEIHRPAQSFTILDSRLEYQIHEKTCGNPVTDFRRRIIREQLLSTILLRNDGNTEAK